MQIWCFGLSPYWLPDSLLELLALQFRFSELRIRQSFGKVGAAAWAIGQSTLDRVQHGHVAASWLLVFEFIGGGRGNFNTAWPLPPTLLQFRCTSPS